ncbi:hypothetical protein DPMN_021517 [Dreissena polymorpha]|uniref:Uncharacterized protein n=1 Tax=Dreissena polymorpha TaxID=45954 RepID=A0A9D4S979_DREPO|nr:hypothetical protein DPMN_021517 [Dreissena polymorpha]
MSPSYWHMPAFKPKTFCEIETFCMRQHSLCLERNVPLIEESAGDVMDPDVANSSTGSSTGSSQYEESTICTVSLQMLQSDVY